MHLKNSLALAVALVACKAAALPVRKLQPRFELRTSGAGAAHSSCSAEGTVVCNNGQYQICASGAWSVSMSLAAGTDCSVFGTPQEGGSGALPEHPAPVRVLPSPVPTTTAPTRAPTIQTHQQPSPSPTSSTVPPPPDSNPAAGGFQDEQIIPEPVAPVAEPVANTLTFAAPVISDTPAPSPEPSPEPAPTTTTPSEQTGGSSESGSDPGLTTPGQLQQYTGSSENFPPTDQWVSFDTMWNLNSGVCNMPENEGKGDVIRQAIERVSQEANLDKRIILAVILQESTCRLSVPSTNMGVNNPGIMQSHNGASYDGTDDSIYRMIKDGVEGTQDGDGLVQTIAKANGDLWDGLRIYNSGPLGIDTHNLSTLPAGTGTASYCSDIANRLTGADVESMKR